MEGMGHACFKNPHFFVLRIALKDSPRPPITKRQHPAPTTDCQLPFFCWRYPPPPPFPP